MTDNRLDLRINPDLKARVKAAASERGQSLTVFTERALESALHPRHNPNGTYALLAIEEEEAERDARANDGRPIFGPKPTAAHKPRPKQGKR